jgi:hypothetical protein
LPGGPAGRNNCQSIAAEAQSVTACTLTPIWQFPTLPSVPEYMRATPGESTPSLAKPLSSITYASGSMNPVRPPGEPLADFDVIPGGGGDELLQLLMIHTEPLGHRLRRLAPAIQQQPTKIQLALRALVRPRQPTEHVGGERLQPRPDLLHLLRRHESEQDHTTNRISGSDTPNKVLLRDRLQFPARDGENISHDTG